ncbi:solute carrier family 23 member 1-like isoform X4 [Dreissena polymorpha]|uniref:solute carrier family 23 member 1-like isoform X4 n=1 Tax=Dreissena polymorpha TaxID=45954 RepID=UPI002263D068|nr:solute carrier family 23 member 1-like isoform X4 [Dreissena polymorpha]
MCVEEIEVISMEDEKLHTRENGCVDSKHHPVRSKAEDEPGVGSECPLIYKISDRPPAHLIFFFGFQQAVISIAHQLVVSLLVAEVVCASNDSALKARLLSSTLFMTGFTTLLMVTIGSRLPLFQGAAIEYLSPLLMLGAVDSTFCATDTKRACVHSANQAVMNVSVFDRVSNATTLMTSLFNNTSISDYERSINAITSLQGSLMVAGALHTFVGFTGLVGVMLRFVGPMTIIPAVLLIGLYMIKATAKFVFVNWIVAVITASVTLFLSLYLGRKKTPIPSWSRAKGFHIVWYPLHQVFSILIGMIVGTVVCAFFTAYNVVPNDPCNPHFRTRTDARIEAMEKSDWLTFPYPGQFGAIGFSSNALVGCLLATVLSILDSVGDYFACARACHVPPPPRHAVNRGLAVEGVCTLLSGAVGCGHATTTYAGNIGAMGLTKVASRWVFVMVGVIYMAIGLLGKLSALFIMIPEPVLGGALLSITAVFIGVILSNLTEISLHSTRNLAILGLSLTVGIMVPHFVETNPDIIKTDNVALSNFLKMFFGNANFAGALCAFILDNTVPGTKKERGILAWSGVKSDASITKKYSEGYELYNPWMPSEMRKSRWLKFIPFLPEPETDMTSLKVNNKIEHEQTEFL